MAADSTDIHLLTSRIDRGLLRRIVDETFDVEKGVIAVGGELHAEQVLLESGSRQEDLWGANYYPGRGREECIEFTSLINIRPGEGNPGMVLEDPALRERVRVLTFALIGEGEALG